MKMLDARRLDLRVEESAQPMPHDREIEMLFSDENMKLIHSNIISHTVRVSLASPLKIQTRLGRRYFFLSSFTVCSHIHLEIHIFVYAIVVPCTLPLLLRASLVDVCLVSFSTFELYAPHTQFLGTNVRSERQIPYHTNTHTNSQVLAAAQQQTVCTSLHIAIVVHFAYSLNSRYIRDDICVFG